MALAHHLDAYLRNFLVAGLTQGFHIGFNSGNPLSSAWWNMPSAEGNAAVVEEYHQRETSAGHLIGPLPATGLHVNKFGVIPKGHTPGKWSLITDVSFPPRRIVNNGIDPERCSMSYITIDVVAK